MSCVCYRVRDKFPFGGNKAIQILIHTGFCNIKFIMTVQTGKIDFSSCWNTHNVDRLRLKGFFNDK